MKVSFCFCSTAILTCLIYIAERGGNMLLSFCYTMIGLVLFYMMAVVKKFILSKPPGRCRLILQGVCNTFALSQAACQRRYQCDHRTCRPGDPASSWSPNSTVLHLDIYLCKYSNLKTPQGNLLRHIGMVQRERILLVIVMIKETMMRMVKACNVTPRWQ